MGSEVTLEKVLAFPGQLGIESMGLQFIFIIPIFMVFFGFVILLLSRKSESLGILGALLLFPGLFLSFICFCSIYDATEEMEIKYEAGYKEWQTEYVKPYIASLPIKQQASIKEVSFDYKLETEMERSFEEAPVGLIPLKITEKDGKTYSLWGKVDYNEKVESPFYLYRELPKTLSFDDAQNARGLKWYPDIEAGKHDVLIYTNNHDLKEFDSVK